jgi:ATP phosphoribosyltransferase regulatory subunit
MTIADRWLLPDGVEELLPEQAAQAEHLRRVLLDLYRSWGYQLVMPPMIEFTDSLLVGLGSDLDLLTFRVTDQLTGRPMGIRPDMTPQVARIDAHSLKQDGPVRLCYAGSVLHARPKNQLASRSPLQIGAELYGDATLASDAEVVLLMLETLRVAGFTGITLDLGHVGIYRALLDVIGLDEQLETQLFDALQRKALAEIDQLLSQHCDAQSSQWLQGLSRLSGDINVLAEAKKLFANAPVAVLTAVNELEAVARRVAARMPSVALYFDLSELRGYHYHTGLVFAALVDGRGQAVASGGRYDHIGEVFGRARPATGFSTDLKALIGLLPVAAGNRSAIAAPDNDDHELWSLIQSLRSNGEQVIVCLSQEGSQQVSQNCDRELVKIDNRWQVRQR